ncbi:MAG: glycosyltransferase family 9 protein [Candidatus Glassbacteria bacterium]
MKKSLKKVLVIQTAFPGDLVLATPLLESIKKMDEMTHLALVTIPKNASLFENSPFVDDLLLYDKSGAEKGIIPFLRLVMRVRREKYDIAFIPHPSLRSALLARFGGVGKRIGFAGRWCSLLYTKSVDADGLSHEVERNLRLLESLGGIDKRAKPRLFPSEADSSLVTEMLKSAAIDAKKPFIAIAPGSNWPTKAWPIDRYRRLIEILSAEYPIVLVGGGEDKEFCESLADMKDRRWANPVVSSAGGANLIQSAVMISRARLLISGDSAPLHLASAMGTPVVVIYGPTVPEFGFYPYGVPYRIVQKELPCRPCSIHGPRECPQDHFSCMRDIDEKEVYDAAVRLIEETEEEQRGTVDEARQ